MENDKVYVDVIARFSTDGHLTPVSFTWENGRVYRIQQIQGCETTWNKYAGIKYTCMVNGMKCSLYYERNFQWFLIRRTA